MTTNEDDIKWYDNWDEHITNNEGRNEAYKLETGRAIKDCTFFERFKTEDKKYLSAICTKAIALFKNPIEINDAVTNLIKYSGYTKKVILDLIKLEREYVDQRQKEEMNKHNSTIKVARGMFQINEFQRNVEEFHKLQPFFYDKSKIFWFWNADKFKYEIVDETDLMLMLDDELGFCGQTVTATMKANYVEAFKRVGRKRHPKEAPLKWIQFKDKAYSIASGKTYDVTPDYFFTNPIPIELGTNESTPIMDKLFEEWVGIEAREQLYELIAYSCYREYPIQLMFVLFGSGANGKSQFLKIHDHFVGSDNTISTSLDQLTGNQFEVFNLYKKLVAYIGETNYNTLEKTDILKKMVDGSKLSFQMKGKMPFYGSSYAKIIIASNSLPSPNDTTDGFWRRFLIIDFPNQFEEKGYEIWKDVPEEEYRNLAYKTCNRLRDLLKFGRFTNQGTIEQRKQKYISVSNPMSLFIKKHCIIGSEEFESYNKLYTAYIGYLAKEKKRRVKGKEFKAILEDEGFYMEKTSKNINGEWKSAYWVMGLKLCADYDNYDHALGQSPYTRSGVDVQSQLSQTSQKLCQSDELIVDNTQQVAEIIYHKCFLCQNTTSTHWYQEKPVCDPCYEKICQKRA